MHTSMLLMLAIKFPMVFTSHRIVGDNVVY